MLKPGISSGAGIVLGLLMCSLAACTSEHAAGAGTDAQASLAGAQAAGAAGEPRVQPAPRSSRHRLRIEPDAGEAAEPWLQAYEPEAFPTACDTLEVDQVAAVVGKPVVKIEHTEHRLGMAPVATSCLYSWGSNPDPIRIDLDSLFVRVDIYTDESFAAQNELPAADQWLYRTSLNARRFILSRGIWAAWVDSDHPPDPALLIRVGDVIFEVAHYPPSSNRGSPERNGQIESLAKTMLSNLGLVGRGQLR